MTSELGYVLVHGKTRITKDVGAVLDDAPSPKTMETNFRPDHGRGTAFYAERCVDMARCASSLSETLERTSNGDQLVVYLNYFKACISQWTNGRFGIHQACSN